ncbi:MULTISPECIES: amidohydrolase family protein [Streptomyces]|uniref:amidohydrolase family protein n=1 Tax=Streptomyces lycopersici TaxID=2974589 RepID=UPI0021D288F6|nr:amidohydrolase family protein [Streptomyces sp. NEAU-383]
MPPVVNVHTHFQPESVLPIVEPYGIEMTAGEDGKSWYFRSGDVEYYLPGTGPDGISKFWGAGLGEQVAEMDSHGVDINVLQPSPMIFSYHLPAKVGATFSRAFNDEVAHHISQQPARFWGSAQLPMQDLDLAAEELRHAVKDLGMKSCSLGYVLGGNRTLADPECDEFLSAVEELDVPILLHPVALGQDIDLKAGGAEWLMKYEVDWAWGYLFVETAAVIGFIFSGALDRHPGLRVMIPHGGGMLPYQVGRLENHMRVFARGDDVLPKSVQEYLASFYFDTVVHDPRGLKLLIDVMGEDNVVLGSNYPGWDNAPMWQTIRELPDVSGPAKDKILGLNATDRLFRTGA